MKRKEDAYFVTAFCSGNADRQFAGFQSARCRNTAFCRFYCSGGYARYPKAFKPFRGKKEKETGCKVGKQNIPVLSNGKYELAMIPLTGWEKTYTVYPEGVHPVSEKCALNMVSDQLSGEKIYVTLQLWKKNEKRGFTSKELTPVKSVHVSEDKKQVTVCLSNGEIKTISFE